MGRIRFVNGTTWNYKQAIQRVRHPWHKIPSRRRKTQRDLPLYCSACADRHRIWRTQVLRTLTYINKVKTCILQSTINTRHVCVINVTICFVPHKLPSRKYVVSCTWYLVIVRGTPRIRLMLLYYARQYQKRKRGFRITATWSLGTGTQFHGNIVHYVQTMYVNVPTYVYYLPSCKRDRVHEISILSPLVPGLAH